MRNLLVMAVILAILSVGVWLAQWFLSPGVHIVPNAVSFQVSTRCYLIDRSTGQIMSECDLMVDGIANGWTGRFNGYMNISAYPLPVEEAYRDKDSHLAQFRDGELLVVYSGTEISDDFTFDFSDTAYILHLSMDDNSRFLITIAEPSRDAVCAVCAANPQEALEYYNQYFAE